MKIEDKAFLKEFPLYNGGETIELLEVGNGVIRCSSLLDDDDGETPYEYYEFNVVLTHSQQWDVIGFWNSNPQKKLSDCFKGYRSKATWA
jgi:hypothetical protein